MVWDVDTGTDEKGREFDASGGGDFNRVSEPGLYHVHVTAVDEGAGTNNDQLAVDCEILGGKPAGQEGKEVRIWFSPKPTARNRVISWALACKITTEEENKKAAAGKRSISLHPKDAIGRHFVVKAEWDEDQKGNPQLKVNFGIYAIDSPEAEGITNKGVLDAAGDAGDDPFGAEGKAASAEGQAVGAEKKDEFGGLFD